jgi:AcrR family transcriptional regulator
MRSGGDGVPRLSRQESRAQTRTQLLAAAQRLFAEKGLGVGLEEIAEAAGFSRGAVYYNFADKNELFAAVLEQRSRQQIAEIASLFNSTVDVGEFFERLRQRDAALSRNSDEVRRWSLLSGEFWLAAARDPAMRERLSAHLLRLRGAYEVAITSVLERLDIAPPLPPEKMAAIIMAIDDGLNRHQWVISESFNADLFIEAMEFLLRAAALMDTSGET